MEIAQQNAMKFLLKRQFKSEVQHLEVFPRGTHRNSLMFTTTKDIPMSYTHLSVLERIDLYQYQSIDKLPIRAIARKMNCSASTISRELGRNRVDETHYLPDTAQMKMQARRQQSKQRFMSVSLSTI